MVENGGWGAQWAAPIASLMIEQYLTDSISRPEIDKRMKEGVIMPKVYYEKFLLQQKKEQQKADSIAKSKKIFVTATPAKTTTTR
jgi:penicillin-binding protein 2